MVIQNRWIAIAMALATHLFTALLAVYLVYVKDESAELTGWTLSVATLFSSNILWLVRIANGFSVEGLYLHSTFCCGPC